MSKKNFRVSWANALLPPEALNGQVRVVIKNLIINFPLSKNHNPIKSLKEIYRAEINSLHVKLNFITFVIFARFLKISGEW
jgi:hypothetical protein